MLFILTLELNIYNLSFFLLILLISFFFILVWFVLLDFWFGFIVFVS